MGNAQELYEVENELKIHHSSEESENDKIELNETALNRHLTILERYSNYVPNYTNISLICASKDYKDSIIIESYAYKDKVKELVIDPYVKNLDFESKQTLLRQHLDSLKIDWSLGADHIIITRENLIDCSIKEFEKVDIYKEVKVQFKGEEEGDAGGMMRELLTSLFKEIQNPEKELFEKADTSDFSLKVYKGNEITEEKKRIYYFIGKILAKALLENITINTCFNLYIYKILLEEPVGPEDLFFIDKDIYHSFDNLLKTKDIDELCLYFCQDEDIGNGQIVSQELITNGSNIKVTKQTLDFYCQKKIEYIMNKDKLLINYIKKGLFTYIPESLIKIFTASELELIINGTPFIDIKDWESNTRYDGYNYKDEIIKNFWKIIGDCTQERLKNLLLFATGSTKVPINGFKALQSNRGQYSLFCITKKEYEKGSKNYLKAHTCFNRIDLPNFPDYDSLKKAIDFVIDNEIMGFGEQ